MPDDDRASTCLLCGKASTHLCGRCKSTRYCSQDCQSDDWPAHKLLCKTFSRFDLTARPSDNHFRSIAFHHSQPKPQVVWVECPWQQVFDYDWQTPNLRPFLGPGLSHDRVQVRRDVILQKLLPDTIDLCFREAFQNDGSRLNKSITAIIETVPGSSYQWHGSVVAVGRKGRVAGYPPCRDLDMNDFRHIVDHLVSFGRWLPFVQSPPSTPGANVVKGIRINCVGDQKVFNRPLFEPVDVADSHPIFDLAITNKPDIADRIGLPVLTQRYPVDLRWVRKEGLGGFENHHATLLHMSCDPTSDNFGLPSWQWLDHAGSFLAVRRDKSPLTPDQAEILCGYCRDEVSPLMAHTWGQYSPEEPMTRDFALSMICKPMFTIYWAKVANEKKRQGRNDISELPPYNN